MDIHKIIIPTPYAVGDVNAFLLKGDALTLFDAGPKTEEAYEALKWGLRAAGYSFQDVEQVVLTHHHPDHAGWVDAFGNAAIYGHAYVDYWMKKDAAFIDYHEHFFKTQLIEQGVPEKYIQRIIQAKGEIELFGTTPLSGYLKEGDAVPGHPNLTVYETPGHAQSHLIFVDEQKREGIVGDLLLARSSSNPLVEPPADLSMRRPQSLLQYNDSLQRLKQMELATLYTGHGEDITDAATIIEERFTRQKQRAMKVMKLLDKPQTTFDITTRLFERIYQQQLGLTLSETLGQFDYLVDGQLVGMEKRDGVYYYYK